jgi:hypothetical protein
MRFFSASFLILSARAKRNEAKPFPAKLFFNRFAGNGFAFCVSARSQHNA